MSITDRVYVNRTGDKVWSPNTKEQLCEAIEELCARVAALTAQRDAAQSLVRHLERRYGLPLTEWVGASPVAADPSPTFDEMLRDPNEQFDKRSELLSSVLEYLDAPSGTATAGAQESPNRVWFTEVAADPPAEEKR